MASEIRAAQETRTITYLQAIVEAQVEEMERDPTVVMMGEDIAVYGDGKLVDRFGKTRIWSTPISEMGFTGIGVGAAMTGLRPIVNLSIASFLYLGADPIINQASKMRFMTGGQMKVPVVFRCSLYYDRAIAAQHSDRPYSMFMNVPGLKIICPAGVADMKGLMKAAIRDDDPVLVFEDARLWGNKEAVPTDPNLVVPIGKAAIVRPGSDVTMVAIAGAMKPALQAAELLAQEGVSVEVIDPRTLKPLDLETVFTSLAKTGRLVLVENAHRICSATSEIAAAAAIEAFDLLKKPIVQVAAPDVHVPFSPVLEKALYPDRDSIAAAVRRVL
jgi:pyruvate/2-oxoglutarate/acetoin dehydrogenase E1 component